MARLQQLAQVVTQEEMNRVPPVGKCGYYLLDPECQASVPQARRKRATDKNIRSVD